jgi:excisionase family DNA binding protein
MATIKSMLSELMHSGFSQSELAKRLDTTQPTISRLIEKGHDPGYQLGKRIEHFYSEQKRSAA